jgi:hypothetical protein
VLAEEETADPGAAEPTADAPPPVALPPDVHTEAEIAAAMKMTRAAIRKVIEEAGVAPVMLAPPGTRGGHRYSLGAVMQAFQLQAMNRADAMRQPSNS